MRIDRIKFAAALAKIDITSKQLSEKTGVSRVTISNVKNGKSCGLLTAQRIAEGLGLTVADIAEMGEGK